MQIISNAKNVDSNTIWKKDKKYEKNFDPILKKNVEKFFFKLKKNRKYTYI